LLISDLYLSYCESGFLKSKSLGGRFYLGGEVPEPPLNDLKGSLKGLCSNLTAPATNFCIYGGA
jgi:hypothetical protein